MPLNGSLRMFSTRDVKIRSSPHPYYQKFQLNQTFPKNITFCELCIVKPVYSRHLRLLKKGSAITRCPLYRVLDFWDKKANQWPGFYMITATPIPVLIKNSFTNSKYSSFSRGYHAYRDVWISNYWRWLLRRT